MGNPTLISLFGIKLNINYIYEDEATKDGGVFLTFPIIVRVKDAG
jgi:hypothetical protein